MTIKQNENNNENKSDLMPEQDEELVPPSIPNLLVEDLNVCKTIIDAACRRGTFNANEMVTVGTVYNKLVAFIDIQLNGIKQDEKLRTTNET